MDFWTILTSLLPSGYELNETSDDECEVTNGDKTIKIIRNDNDFVVNNITLHFEDDNNEIINTLLIPYILQELDGIKRF